jgi:hypothetical protein
VKEKKIRVVAYAGYRNEELPRQFYIDDEQIDVSKVIRSWTMEDKESDKRQRFFKVKGSDGYIHTILYDEFSQEWFLAV